MGDGGLEGSCCASLALCSKIMDGLPIMYLTATYSLDMHWIYMQTRWFRTMVMWCPLLRWVTEGRSIVSYLFSVYGFPHAHHLLGSLRLDAASRADKQWRWGEQSQPDCQTKKTRSLSYATKSITATCLIRSRADTCERCDSTTFFSQLTLSSSHPSLLWTLMCLSTLLCMQVCWNQVAFWVPSERI